VPKTRDFIVEFKRVRLDKSVKRSFDELLAYCAGINRSDPKRHRVAGTKVIALRTIMKRGGIWYGDFYGIATHDLPDKVSFIGDVEPIDLKEDQGIGKGVAFMFDPTLDIIVYQREAHAASIAAMREFFRERLTDFGEIGLDFDFVLSRDAMEKLDKMPRFSKMRFKVAGGQSGDVIANQDRAIRDALTWCKEAQAATIDVEVSVGRQKRSLDRSLIDQLLGALGGKLPPNDVQKAVVTGEMLDSGMETIDFIEERLRDTHVVQATRRALDLQQRQGYLRKSYRKYRAEIANMFGVDSDS